MLLQLTDHVQNTMQSDKWCPMLGNAAAPVNPFSIALIMTG
jgi:hypothetical protein